VYLIHLEINVQEIVTASTNPVILYTVHVLLVDVIVDIKAVPVVQVCDNINYLYIGGN
jgi:hypothetical protein